MGCLKAWQPSMGQRMEQEAAVCEWRWEAGPVNFSPWEKKRSFFPKALDCQFCTKADISLRTQGEFGQKSPNGPQKGGLGM
jgi:hypothetical protein